MEINESSQIYLKNYYVLEQTRSETNQFLEEIALRLAMMIEEDIKSKNTDEIYFHKYVQKGGGFVEFYYDNKEGIRGLNNIGRWKYTINYRDAMRSEDLSASTKCKVYGYSPQSVGEQIRAVTRMAKIMKLPDPYRTLEFDLLDAPIDEVIVKLKNAFIEFHTDFLKITEALIEELKVE